MVGVLAVLAVVMIGNTSWAMESDQEGGVRGLSERVAEVESALEKMGVTLSGAIEVEAAFTDDERESGETSDITLATVELGVDVNPVKHVSGHVLFLFEEDDTEPVTGFLHSCVTDLVFRIDPSILQYLQPVDRFTFQCTDQYEA